MFLQVNGKKIHYEEKGSGEPILFVHGWPASIKSLQKLFLLASKKNRAIIIDLPGFGTSDNPDPNWGIEEYAKHLTTFLSELGISKINYFGHSFGGALGIYIAGEHPELLKKLILCDSSYKREGKRSKTTSILKKIFLKIEPAQKFESHIKKVYYRVFFPQSDLLKAPHLERNFRKIVTQDLTPYLSKIKVPTLILWGQLDTMTPIHWAYELNEKIKKSKLVVFPNSSHNLPLKSPEDVFEEVEKFL